MPIGTAALIMGGISAAGGIAKTVSGAIGQRKANKAIDNYERQDLDNAFENIQINTLESDIFKEEGQRFNAMALDNLRSGGVRSVIGGVPMLQAGSNLRDQEGRNYLGNKIEKREYGIAYDNARIRQMQERREELDLAGLGQKLDVMRNQMWNGLGSIGSAGMFLANNFTGEPRRPKNLTAVSEIEPYGVQGL